jgi:hypothetical protein
VALLEWSQDLPDWKRDALHRIAISEQLSPADRVAIRVRLMYAHGIAVSDDVACIPLVAEDLPVAADESEPTILCGIGPVQNVDKLAHDQELRCGVRGITLNFGDNGAGKSGYARVAKKLCLARVVDDLQGDVFAEQPPPSPRVRVRYRLPGVVAPEIFDWTDGSARPAALARMMVLDTANARIYVDGRNEITYLPREIEVAARFGELCTSLATEIQRDIDAIAQRYRGPYGAVYDPATPAGRLSRLLDAETGLHAIPSELDFRAAAAWDQAREAELTALELALAQNPAGKAAAMRRVERVLNALAAEFDAATALISDQAVSALSGLLTQSIETARTVALSARDYFAGEPIPYTGQGDWARMYEYARKFAAESGVRNLAEPFQLGDPCPVCQHELDEQTTARLHRFDEFVRGAAATDAEMARAALDAAAAELHVLLIADRTLVEQNIAEYRDSGEAAARTAQLVLNYVDALSARKTVILAGIEQRSLGAFESLPASPANILRAEPTAQSNHLI